MMSLIRTTGVILVLCACAGFASLFEGPAAKLDPFWNISNAESRQSVDHRAWQRILDDYLVEDPSGINLFDYEGISEDDARPVDSYVKSLTAIDPRRLNKAEQMSYWINLYNALTVQLIARNYPVDSITSLGKGLLSRGPWEDKVVQVSGRPLSLNDIEHRILRPIFRDHRIHFAVNCASIGCPNLAARAYTADRLEDMLSNMTRRYLTDPRGLQIDGDQMILSRIFQWYRRDFGESEAEVLVTLSRYLEPPLAPLVREFKGKIEYRYDWSLNSL